MQTKTDFTTALKKKGLKVTKHRNSLLEVLEIENQPLTAEDIFLKLKEQGISINLSSVNWILDTYADYNFIINYVLWYTNKTFYEINTLKHKHHLVFTFCIKIFPFENCPLSKYESELEDNLDFEITKPCNLFLSGIGFVHLVSLDAKVTIRIFKMIDVEIRNDD